MSVVPFIGPFDHLSVVILRRLPVSVFYSARPQSAPLGSTVSVVELSGLGRLENGTTEH